MMPTDQYTYFRYEIVRTPSFGEFANQSGDSSFSYEGSSLGFKLGYNFLFNPFKDNSKDYTSLNINGPYASLGLQQQSTQIDFQNKIAFAGGAKTRVETFVRPASSTQYSYHLGYASGVASQNLYIALDYQHDNLLSYNKQDNHFHSNSENFYYRPYMSKTYSLAFGYRPHPSDLIFARVGSTQLEIHRLNASNIRNIENKTLSKGTLFGLGVETSLSSYLSWFAEYDYSLYRDTSTESSKIAPSNHAISAGITVRP